MWNKWSIIHNSNYSDSFFSKSLPCPSYGNVANGDWRLLSSIFCSRCSQNNTDDFEMVSSYVLWNMKIYDCVYLTVWISNKVSLGSTVNRLVNFLDKKKFFFSQWLLGWDSTNCATSQCCSVFIYEITDKEISWSVKVCVKLLLQKATQEFSSNTDQELSYHSSLLIHWI